MPQPGRNVRSFDPPDQVHLRLSEALFQVGQLGGPDSVLAGDRAAELDGGAEDLGEGAPRHGRFPRCPRRIASTQVGCRLPSPACPKVAMVTPCRAAIASMRATIWPAASLRHAGVLENRQRAQPGRRRKRAAPGGQQRLRLGGITRRSGLRSAPESSQDSCDSLEAACHGRLVAVVAEQQQGTGAGMKARCRR